MKLRSAAIFSILILTFATSIPCQAQKLNTDTLMEKLRQGQAELDSVMKLADERNRVRDSINFARELENQSRNLDNFLAQRKAEEDKQLKWLYVKGALFVFMLVSVIVSLVRNRKAKKAANENKEI